MYTKPDESLDTLRKSSEVPSEPKRTSNSSNAGTNLGLGIISLPPLSYHHSKDPKSIYKLLVHRISQQEAVISAIVETITGPRKTAGPQNVWIHIRGPDRLGKKKLGLALAEILYGSRECLVYADLSFEKRSNRVETLFHQQLTNKYELKMRGTVIDFLVEKLSRNPSVVLLENIDKADLVVQNSLLQAVKKGRLTDLRGKEVNISNCIFLGSSSHTARNEENSNKFIEEDILNAKGGSIKMMMMTGFDLNNEPTNQNSFFSNKRKLLEENVITGHRESGCKASKSSLDLNLPAEGGETCDILSRNFEPDSDYGTSWVEEDFEGLVDRTVVFGRLDFDLLAERVCEEINSCLRSAVGLECSVEIENDVMRQILAGGYLYGNERVGIWVQNVVRGAFLEVGEKFGVSARSVVKIVGWEGTACDDELLPNRILVG
ncbi:Double Clp-N motif-containing P-loop nucleoside triphosphate hydrolases superfamily protein [Striga hermonthica]|uniref:Double Clp-N motif-containing P-loop nucleoside triphosphate hydrolases superfamily protein n=1 Tax=Striga hermonthica TaxID=68872 RepID=A0A9N7RPX3_STRHE|nr:Double Clp-N motif-containing P-loop nucleoside triphosphate hydrolases superfamily protein [Striga hermonthica]